MVWIVNVSKVAFNKDKEIAQKFKSKWLTLTQWSQFVVSLFLSPPSPATWSPSSTTALHRNHDECVAVLAGLRLWHSQQLQGGLQGYILNPVFKDNLRIALLGGYVCSPFHHIDCLLSKGPFLLEAFRQAVASLHLCFFSSPFGVANERWNNTCASFCVLQQISVNTH